MVHLCSDSLGKRSNASAVCSCYICSCLGTRRLSSVTLQTKASLVQERRRGWLVPRCLPPPSLSSPVLWVWAWSVLDLLGWPSGWLSGGQSSNSHPHPKAVMEPQHTVCGPGSGKRGRGKGLGSEEKAAPYYPHMIPDIC